MAVCCIRAIRPAEPGSLPPAASLLHRSGVMRIDAEQLAARGLSLDLDRPGMQRRLVLAPTRAVTGYYAHDRAGHRIVATAAPGLAVRRFDWQVGGVRIAARAATGGQPAEIEGVSVDLTVPTGGAGASGTAAWRRARLGTLTVWLPGLPEPIDLHGVDVHGLAVAFADGRHRVRADWAGVDRATMVHGDLTIDIERVVITDLRVDGDDILVGDVAVGSIRLEHADLRGALTSRPAGDASAGEGEPARAPRRLDLGFADGLQGQVDVDLTADATVPLLGARKATHRFRIPIDNGTIDFKELENDLAALEDAVLDFVFKKGALHLVKDIPLIPFDTRTLIYWPLDEDEHEMAASNRVRLRRLADYQLPESTSSQKKSNGGSSVELRTLHFDNLSIDLTLGGPASVELAGGRITLGSEERAAIGSLHVEGDIHHHTGDTSDVTSVAVESVDWELQLEGLSLGNRLLDVELVTLARIDEATITFEDVRPGAVTVAAQGLHLRGVQLHSAADHRPAMLSSSLQ